MADLAAIITFVSRGSKLSLKLFRLAATAPWAAKSLREVATAVSNFSLTIKQVGATIKENDSYPSPEALETIQDILEQCKAIYNEIQAILPDGGTRTHSKRAPQDKNQYGNWKPKPSSIARLEYLSSHLRALQATLSTMLQTFYTAEIILWARTRPTISPKRMAKAVRNERNQLETLIIEQQIAFILASHIYDEHHHTEALLLMEEDSSRSLATIEEKKDTVTPSDLFHYQHPSLANLDSSNNEHDWCFAVSEVSTARIDQLLERWTRLQQLQAEIDEQERRAGAERREAQQPTVESDSDDDELGDLPRLRHGSDRDRIVTPTPLRPHGNQPLFSDSPTLPIPVHNGVRPTAPLSPASSFGVSPRSSGKVVASSGPEDQNDARSPGANLPMFPVQATAAVDGKDEDDISGLQIPWKLCSKTYYWEYIDGKVKKSNTDAAPSIAINDRNSWTEIMASWVCKEAIEEAGYSYTRVQKDRLDSRRTKFELCFCIQRPLTFAEVHQLIERTVEIYRQNQPPTPPPSASKHHSSSSRRERSPQPKSPGHKRDRPSISTAQPPQTRSTTSLPIPPPPPHLDRTTSLPGHFPPHPQYPYMNPHASTGYLPIPKFQVPYSPQAPYASQQTLLQQPMFNPADPRRASNPYFPPPQPPLRQSYVQQPYVNNHKHHSSDDYSSELLSSDSDTHTKSRKHKSSRSSERRGSNEKKKKKTHSTVGTLAKVGGLAALLDGVVELGIL